MPTPVQTTATHLADRAQAILDDSNKYSQKDIMTSAFNDFKALGSITGLMSVMSTGKLSTQQVEIVKRVATKAIAVLSQYEENKNDTNLLPPKSG